MTREPVSHMIAAHEVVLDVATPSDVGLIGNLLELYTHDLSDVFPVQLGTDGRFGYQQLPLYWLEPERRYPFLIRCGGQVAGFALIKRASSEPSGADDFDVAEFFVLRRFRRSGVGRAAALLVWNRWVGHWTVRVSEGNRSGVRFWASIIAEYAHGSQVETTRAGDPHPWRVFTFDSATRRASD